MIYSVTGKTTLKTDSFLIIETHGVGYQVFVPTTILENLPEASENLTLYTVHHIREDSQQLFGFSTVDERDFFTTLTSVSGCGPKLGIKILSSLTVDQIASAILKEDLGVLTSVSGIGKKMAERLVIELKDKLPNTLILHTSASSYSVQGLSTQTDDDVFLGLKSLGYSSEEIKRAYHRSVKELDADMAVEDCIKILLKQL